MHINDCSMVLNAAAQSERRGTSARKRRLGLFALALALAGAASPLAVRADSTGEQAPTATTGGFTNGANAFVCDDVNVAVPTANNQVQSYSTYGLSLPGNAIVTGIQVRVRANDGNKNNRKINVSLSWDGGTTFTAPLATRNFRRNTPIRDYLVGGSAVLWGRTWTVAELSNTNFRVKAVARMPGGVGSDVIHLDCIPVTVFYRIPGAPNLSVDKIDSPDPVQPQADLTYTIAYGNTGESTATNTLIADAVPANTTFVSATPAPVTAPAVGGTGTVVWNVGSVALGDTGVVSMVVKVDANLANGTLLSNDNYSIASDQNTSTFGNAVTTTVQGTIALALTKTGTPDPVAPGGTLTYVLTLSNGGNAPSTNLVVNDAYDGNVAYDSYTSTCAGISGGPDQWTIPSLSAGASCTITIATTVTSPLADGVLLVNVADVIDDAASAAEATAITSVRNPAVCGDSIITTPEEECDEGAANGTTGSCCTAACAIRAAGQTCRPAAGECDVAETCDGAAAACPTNLFVASGIDCTDDGNGCTNDECNGAGACAHPDNSDPCNDGSFCNGADTCGGGSCSIHAGDPCTTGPECAQTCNETADNCYALAGAACGNANDTTCDNPDTCNGSGSCLANHEPTATVCRADVDACDVAEHCDGAGGCPANAFEPAGTACGDPGSSVCDNPDTCNASGLCLANHEPTNTVCRPDAGACDVAETCDGGGGCPVDGFEPSGVPCGNASDTVCDDPDSCDGGGTCAANHEPATTVCRPDAGDCDVEELCNGAGACPSDTLEPDGTSCDDALFCTVSDQCTGGVCDGATMDCSTSDTQCRTGTCNEDTDQCDGPAKPNGTTCNDDDRCTTPDTCSAGECGGVPDSLACLDYFSCYKAGAAPGAVKFPGVASVSLVDAFGSSASALTKPKWLCAPASKNGEDAGASSRPDHLEGYQLKPLARFAGATVSLQDWLGNTSVRLKKPSRLLVPTAKSLQSTPAEPTSPTVDHFQCYKVKVTSTTATLPQLNVSLADQFGTQTAELIKVKQVCVPVDTDGEEPGAGDHTGYMVCYLQRSLPKFIKQSPVYTANDLGDEQLAVVKPTILCMPALKLP